MDKELLSLIETATSESPNESLCHLIGSCFADGDLSHISDEELKKNLEVVIEVNREQAA